MLDEVIQLGGVESFEGGEGGFAGGVEFVVAAFLFLEAFDVGAELIGGFDQPGVVRIEGFIDEGGIGGAEGSGELIEEAGFCILLDQAVGFADAFIEIFNRGWQVAGIDLGSIMEESG